jgi:hypothetical protein
MDRKSETILTRIAFLLCGYSFHTFFEGGVPVQQRHGSRRLSLLALSVLVFSLALLPGRLASAQVQSPQPPPSPQAIPPAPPADSAEQAAPAASQRTVRLSDAKGDVQVYQGGQLVFQHALPNMPLTQGMRIVTGSDGRAEVQFEDGSVARAAPNSSFALAELTTGPDGSLVTGIDALSGLTYYEINGQGGQYTVRFGPQTISPTGNAVFRIDLDNNAAEVADMQGNLQFLQEQNLIVATYAGQSIRFNPDDPSLYTLSDTIPTDSWDQWNSNRDQQLAQLQQEGAQSGAANGNPDNAAWDDLNYYGDWYNVPGYGEAWAPSGVGQDWDPFGVGAWSYYPSFGYTWISAYPWGWWPYHCGAWSWFDGYGWLWFPGNCGWGGYGGYSTGWYPYVNVWTVPPGYSVPPRPSNPPFRPHHGIHGPQHRIDGYPLVTVNRGQQFASVFHPVGSGGPRPVPRAFHWNGHTVRPIPRVKPPSGIGPPSSGNGFQPRPVVPFGGFRTPYRPVNPGLPHTFQPGSGFRPKLPANNGSRPGNGGGNHAPFNGFHPAPMPRPVPEPRPGPVFRPAPVFHPAPPPHIAAPPHIAPVSPHGHR